MSDQENNNETPERAALDAQLERLRQSLSKNPFTDPSEGAGQGSEMTTAVVETYTEPEPDEQQSTSLVDQSELFPRPAEGIVFNGRNLERMAHRIFPHSRAQHVKDDVRTIEVGQGFIRIKAIPSTGHYTHKVQETLLACLKHWQLNANHAGTIEVTMSELCRLKGLKPTGENIVLVKKHLNILYDTVQDWVKAFDVSGEPTDMMKFRFLAEFRYRDGSKRGDVSNFDKQVYLQFNPLLTADMINGNINPIAMTTLLSIRNEMAASWFKYTDTRITQNGVGRITGRSMVEKLMMSPTRYKKPSKRYQLLNTLKEHCHGKELSDGRLYECWVERTADGKDYMLIERAGGEVFKFKPRKLPAVNTEPDQIEYLAHQIFDLVGGEQNMQWYRFIGRHVSTNTIFRAISEYKESVQHTKPISPSKYFTGILHTLMHSMGKEWIAKDGCGTNCPHRPDLIKH